MKLCLNNLKEMNIDFLSINFLKLNQTIAQEVTKLFLQALNDNDYQ